MAFYRRGGYSRRPSFGRGRSATPRRSYGRPMGRSSYARRPAYGRGQYARRFYVGGRRY